MWAFGARSKRSTKHTHFVTIVDIRFFVRRKRGFLLIKRCCFLEEGDLQALAPVYSKGIRKEGISFVCGDKMISHHWQAHSSRTQQDRLSKWATSPDPGGFLGTYWVLPR